MVAIERQAPRIQNARLYLARKVGALELSTTEEILNIDEIINDAQSYLVTTRPEYGATTLGRRLLAKIKSHGDIAFF